jgi:Phage integrase family
MVTRRELRRAGARAGVRRRLAPHQLRHAHAVEMAHEGVPMVIIQRQLGHAHLGITSIYLQGIDNAEIIDAVHHRPAPVIPASAGLRTPWPGDPPDSRPRPNTLETSRSLPSTTPHR